MNSISREELKNKLDTKENFRLLMCMSEEVFSLKHIPGSVCFNVNNAPNCSFDPEEEIIVYCTGKECSYSKNAYNFLEGKGYKKIYHYIGGLEDWENAGYSLEGNSAQ